MALPKIDLPTFELKIVSHPTPIRFRPFLVKEEKLLLMALQSGEDESILKTIKQVINNCLIDEIDIDKIPIFDIEYLFLNIRARSIGEEIETYFLCRNIVETIKKEDGSEEGIECKHMMPVKVNLLEIKPPINDLSPKIYLTDKIGVKLNFPTLRSLKSIESIVLSDDAADLFNMVYDCLDYVFDEEGMYYKKESSKEEFVEFMESLTQEQFDKITGFFESLPKISYNLDHKCQKCGYDHKLHLEGLNDFFI